MNEYLKLLSPFIDMLAEMKIMQENRKKSIKEDWKKSINYPRKMKKRIRKELLLDWSIANYDPFEY